MIRRLVVRLLADLALIPVLAFVVHLLVASLPLRADSDAKMAAPSSITRQMDEQLGRGEVLGFLRPWRLLLEGARLGTESRRYDAADLARALAGSLRIGVLAMAFALILATLYSSIRAAVGLARQHPSAGGGASRLLGAALELLPTLVYGTPTFILALVVATFTSVSLDDDKTAFEPIAALVMAIGPGIFLGVILHDALAAELHKPYFLTAIAKGRTRSEAILRHALPNALPALLDAAPPVATAMLAGSFVVEKLFNVTYFGLLYVFAAQQRQVALVVVGTTIFATILVLVTLAVDLLRLLVDPRARAGAADLAERP